MDKEKILEINNLHTSFFTHIGEVKAVRGISLRVGRGETLGIVGESGCGKSVSIMSVMGLLAETGRITAGQILFQGRDITCPVLKIGVQLTEHLIKHKKVSRAEARRQAVDMMRLVGIPDAERRTSQYPREFSGGMR